MNIVPIISCSGFVICRERARIINTLSMFTIPRAYLTENETWIMGGCEKDGKKGKRTCLRERCRHRFYPWHMDLQREDRKSPLSTPWRDLQVKKQPWNKNQKKGDGVTVTCDRHDAAIHSNLIATTHTLKKRKKLLLGNLTSWKIHITESQGKIYLILSMLRRTSSEMTQGDQYAQDRTHWAPQPPSWDRWHASLPPERSPKSCPVPRIPRYSGLQVLWSLGFCLTLHIQVNNAW